MTTVLDRIVIMMGVAGCGKSTVAQALALATDLPFIEGDDFHPIANRQKMVGGTPLDDADRWPWLDTIAAAVHGPAVIACSALKRRYRDRLRGNLPLQPLFVLLDAPRDLLAQRLASRSDHFMPPWLLQSQLDTLEPPEPDEQDCLGLDGQLPVATIVAILCQKLGSP